MRFFDKVILITGAAQGIGECTAKSFAKEGGIVVLTDIEASLVKQASESIDAGHGKSISFRLDVTNQEEINLVVKECIKKFGKIDVLVNSAGIYKEAPFLSMSEQEWDETLNVNLKGTFLCCQSVAREMVRKKSGKIICIASIAAERGAIPGRLHYGTSKGGVLAFCKALALELIPFGINVNCVAPGLIFTRMAKDYIEKKGKDFIKSLPMARVGTVQEVADSILFLASKESSYITGCTIDVNGGWLMR
jgi:NAD(P)-dependent dehydrogenase (short-subunit alcohol dehydrogenase family)